jgi:hypothetical protein
MFNCSCNLVQGKGDLRCACQPIKTDGDPYIYKRMECIQFTRERRQATTAKATRPSSNLDTRKTHTPLLISTPRSAHGPSYTITLDADMSLHSSVPTSSEAFRLPSAQDASIVVSNIPTAPDHFGDRFNNFGRCSTVLLL